MQLAMKTIKLFTVTFLLQLLALSMPGQYLTSVTSEPAITDQTGFSIKDECQASFFAILDSLTSYPFNYHFKDLSTGNINTWYWDFGDGSFSLEQNPTHQFEEPGDYEICLTIANQNDTSDCFDQACMNITTLDYYSLGGLVYAGEYPLNNPVIAGDTGVASLYRIVNNQIVFVEDQYFQEYGYYWFGYLFPGEYMVKISLTPGSTHFDQYFTTYFGDEISWTKADLLTVSNTNLYEAEIHLKPVQELNSGTGIIRGYVNFEQDYVYSLPPMAQTTVILADKDHVPLTFTHPNASGYFEFTGIPFESYFVSADATGKPSSTININLSENMQIVEGINLTIFGSNSNSIPEGFKKGIFLSRIYPNPVKENLHISLYSGISAPIGIKITDLSGKCYFTTTGKFETGINQIMIPTGSLHSGVYFVILQPQGNYLPVAAKFVK
jgi:hypothetical protein